MSKPCERCLIKIHKYNHTGDEYYAEGKDGFIIWLYKKGDKNYTGKSGVYEEDEYTTYV